MNTLLLNREFRLPEDNWYHIVPLGEFRVRSGSGREFIQVVDAAAVAAMINRFKSESAKPNFGGLLIDYDHFSLDTGKSSRAAGWINDLQNREDGLWGQIRWTEAGKADVEGGAYRYISPVFKRGDCADLGGARLRPERLSNAAVTNEPNMRGMVPLSNRGTAADRKEPEMKKELAKLLGLAEDAADDAITAKVGDLVNRAKDVDTLQAQVDKLKKDALEKDVEADLTEFGDVISNRDDVKAQLLANREGTLKVLRGLKKPESQEDEDLPNRKKGKIPSGEAKDEEKLRAEQKKASAIRNRASQIKEREGVTFSQAWDRAKAELAD